MQKKKGEFIHDIVIKKNYCVKLMSGLGIYSRSKLRGKISKQSITTIRGAKAGVN